MLFKKSFKSSKLYLSIFFILISVVGFLYSSRLAGKVEAVTASIQLSSMADTYVDSNNPSGNYGTKTSLYLDGGPNIAVAYLKYDLTQLSGKVVTTARLRLKTTTNSYAGTNGTDNIKLVEDASWSETGITYNLRPVVSSTILGSLSSTVISTVYEVNLDPSVVNTKVGGLISLAIDTISSDGSYFYSKESGTIPTLIVEYSDGGVTPTPTPTPTSSPTPILTPTPTPTPTPLGLDPVIVAAGDIACNTTGATSTKCQYFKTSDLIGLINPNAVLALGDEQYNSGEYNNFLNYYHPSWGRFKNITYPVPGNHEYGTTNAKGYFDYFNGLDNFTGPAGDRDKGYYSFKLGGWYIIALNSNCSKVGGCNAGSAQETWLRQVLAANPTQCALAFWHHSYYTSGTRGWTLEVKPLVQALYDNGADLLLVGHNHFYERFAPQNPDGVLDLSRGIREIIVGTGGKEVLNLGQNTYPNREVRDTTSFGVLKVALHPDSYDWQFVPASGYPFTDSGTGACH